LIFIGNLLEIKEFITSARGTTTPKRLFSNLAL